MPMPTPVPTVLVMRSLMSATRYWQGARPQLPVYWVSSMASETPKPVARLRRAPHSRKSPQRRPRGANSATLRTIWRTSQLARAVWSGWPAKCRAMSEK